MIPRTKRIIKKLNGLISSLFKFIGLFILKFSMLIYFSILFVINKVLNLFNKNFVKLNVSYKQMILDIIRNE